jgi:hypothetical protein
VFGLDARVVLEGVAVLHCLRKAVKTGKRCDCNPQTKGYTLQITDLPWIRSSHIDSWQLPRRFIMHVRR